MKNKNKIIFLLEDGELARKEAKFLLEGSFTCIIVRNLKKAKKVVKCLLDKKIIPDYWLIDGRDEGAKKRQDLFMAEGFFYFLREEMGVLLNPDFFHIFTSNKSPGDEHVAEKYSVGIIEKTWDPNFKKIFLEKGGKK